MRVIKISSSWRVAECELFRQAPYEIRSWAVVNKFDDKQLITPRVECFLNRVLSQVPRINQLEWLRELIFHSNTCNQFGIDWESRRKRIASIIESQAFPIPSDFGQCLRLRASQLIDAITTERFCVCSAILNVWIDFIVLRYVFSISIRALCEVSGRSQPAD